MGVFFTILLWILAAYLTGGLAFLIALLAKGLSKVDQNAGEVSMIFKVLIAPGIILFWPILLSKWYYWIKENNDS